MVWLPLFALAVLYLDTQVDHLCGRNVLCMRKIGLSDVQILSIALGNYVWLNSAICFVLNYFVSPDAFTLSCYYQNFGWRALTKVLVNIWLVDWAFAAGHYLLHTVSFLRRTHIMHHSNLRPSYSTNYFFDPIDLLIESAGPSGACVPFLFFSPPLQF